MWQGSSLSAGQDNEYSFPYIRTCRRIAWVRGRAGDGQSALWDAQSLDGLDQRILFASSDAHRHPAPQKFLRNRQTDASARPRDQCRGCGTHDMPASVGRATALNSHAIRVPFPNSHRSAQCPPELLRLGYAPLRTTHKRSDAKTFAGANGVLMCWASAIHATTYENDS